jgi:16S rRNA C967 or C1407 C5-methylase (RsmB/RsmF family)
LAVSVGRTNCPNLQPEKKSNVLPGGYVVYSTCSLSPAQNDGVIQSALEHVWKETNIDFTIVDLSYMQTLFGRTFDFFSGCRFGQAKSNFY